jgi:hypothetical protein
MSGMLVVFRLLAFADLPKLLLGSSVKRDARALHVLRRS